MEKLNDVTPALAGPRTQRSRSRRKPGGGVLALPRAAPRGTPSGGEGRGESPGRGHGGR